jgi:hypothetical protein
MGTAILTGNQLVVEGLWENVGAISPYQRGPHQPRLQSVNDRREGSENRNRQLDQIYRRPLIAFSIIGGGVGVFLGLCLLESDRRWVGAIVLCGSTLLICAWPILVLARL